jgi:hypothetical protein
VTYVTADGTVVPNLGEKHVNVVTRDGAQWLIRMQVTNVRKSLMSVSKVCEEGHLVVFEQHAGYIEHLSPGHRTPFARRNGVYVLDLHVQPPRGFTRPGM